jgi:hypothetical protein
MDSKSQKNASPVAPINIPPYGVINQDGATYLAGRPIPAGFRVKPSSTLVSDAIEWEKWLETLANEMADFLWPIYENGAWKGKSSSNAEALTRADLQLMQTLTPKIDERIIGNNSLTVLQRAAFKQEDDAPPGPSFAYYQPRMPAVLSEELGKVIMVGGANIARPASQALKRLFQRPRPQHMALLMGMEDLKVQASITAITPAMISGHCIQGTMALAHVIFSMGEALNTIAGSSDDIEKYLIDTGDRRVYAGLHYPSDNLGSWYVSLRMCDHLYGIKAPAVKAQLWKSIQAGQVFKAVHQKKSTEPIYGAILAQLELAALK